MEAEPYNFSLRLPRPLAIELAAIAWQRHQSRNQLIVDVLAQFLEARTHPEEAADELAV